MKNSSGYCVVLLSPPSRWSGLKSICLSISVRRNESPPSRWSGLKFCFVPSGIGANIVSTLAVEWIEILIAAASMPLRERLHPRGGVD